MKKIKKIILQFNIEKIPKQKIFLKKIFPMFNHYPRITQLVYLWQRHRMYLPLQPQLILWFISHKPFVEFSKPSTTATVLGVALVQSEQRSAAANPCGVLPLHTGAATSVPRTWFVSIVPSSISAQLLAKGVMLPFLLLYQ